jgi:hypothetical protein
VRQSIRAIGPQFSAERMVQDYAERMYHAGVPSP